MTTVACQGMERVKAWIRLSRPPFHLVGVLPFTLGAVMAKAFTGTFHWGVWSLGTAAVVLIMMSTYFAGEYYDYEGDRISRQTNPSRFAGGSGVLPEGALPRHKGFIAALICLMLAGVVGLFIWLGLGTGPLTLPLGLVGMVGGFFYSTTPVRWAATGIGELWIALCYGWLPVATAYYLCTGGFEGLNHWVTLPIAATIFNVILLNEYPDYQADMATGKRNMLVRLGLRRGAFLFALVHVVGWIGMALSLARGVPLNALYFYAPVFVVSFWLVWAVLNGIYRDSKRLEVACGLNIAVNLGTTLSYILAFL